jgi:hypothetical protein
METLKDPRVDAILPNKAESDPQFAEDMWRLRHPEKDGKKLSLAEVLVELQASHGIEVSMSTLCAFYKWLSVRRDFKATNDVIRQVKAEMRADPDFTEEEVEKAGRMMFATRGMAIKDPKMFQAAIKLGHGRTALDQRNKQLKQRDKELTQREKLVEHSERKLAMLEAKAARLDALEAKAKEIHGDNTLTPEEQRQALLDKMDDFFGLKKTA